MAPVVVAGVLVVGAVTVMGVTARHTLGIDRVFALAVMGGCNLTAKPATIRMVVGFAHRSVSISASPRGPIRMGEVGVEQHAQDSWTAMSGGI